MQVSHSIWRMGFRPFFLFSTLYGVLVMGLWVGALQGWWKMPVNGIEWHAHEMLVGFLGGIFGGFLLTASSNWTKTRGLHGTGLLLLWLGWLAGRLAFLFQWWWPQPWLLWLDLLFLPTLTAVLWPLLWKREQLRNIPILFWLSSLCLFQFFFLADWTGLLQGWSRTALFGMLGVEIFLLLLIGGRILPFFTSRILQDRPVTKWVMMDRLALGIAAVFVFSVAIFGIQHTATGVLAILTGATALLRSFTWSGWRTGGTPLLAVLHVGWFWIVVAFALLAMASFGVLPLRAGVHAMTVGGLSIFVLGMISRVSLGHTGRPLTASRWMTVAYLLLLVAAILRVLPAIRPWIDYHHSLLWSGLLWCAAFLVFVIEYAPILWSPRADGRDG